MEIFQNYPTWFLPILIVLVLWDVVWKVIAMWKSARNNHLIWFICITIFNTIGILPIVYILIQRKKDLYLQPKNN